MIHLEIQNIFSAKIGSRNGLDQRFLNDFLNKNQSHVKTIFNASNQPGYAFLKSPDDTKTLHEIQKTVKSEQKRKWQNIVVLGIGGSALGGIALQEALLGTNSNLNQTPRLFFIDNIDPDFVHSIFTQLNVKKTLFIVVSKSGGTVEPMALYSIVKEKLIKIAPKHYADHLIFITDPKSGLLQKIGKEEKIRIFGIPSKVGGRFSVLTSAALLPAALAGVDIKGLLKGAKSMKNQIQKSKSAENPALLLALLQFLMDQKKGNPMTVMMPYSNRLFRFADWYRQLLAESIGKNKKTGPTPISALGSTDQHSQIQLYNEGQENKWILFLKVNKPNNDLTLGKNLPKELEFLNGQKLSKILEASYQGTSESLAQNNRPNITLTLDKINAETLGELIMLFECQVALLGLLYNVNAFDQPGVEAGKLMTKEILSTHTQTQT